MDIKNEDNKKICCGLSGGAIQEYPKGILPQCQQP